MKHMNKENHPIMTDFEIGSLIYTNIKQKSPQEPIVLKSKVVDYEDDNLVIEIPIDEANGKCVNSPISTELTVWQLTNAGQIISFDTEVTGSSNRNLSCLLIKGPGKGGITITQRREFFRVTTNLRLDLLCDHPKIELSTEMINISGGGLAFICDKEIHFDYGQTVNGKINLPVSNTLLEIRFVARVVRVNKKEENDKVSRTQTVSCKFIIITEIDRDQIIRFCLKRQIELRRKGLLH